MMTVVMTTEGKPPPPCRYTDRGGKALAQRWGVKGHLCQMYTSLIFTPASHVNITNNTQPHDS